VTRQRVLRGVALAAGVLALVALNYYLRSRLENAGQYLYSFLEYFYPEATKTIFAADFPTWKLFLPLREYTGSWTTTTLLLTHAVELRIGTANTWYLFNAILIVVSFVTSWLMFRSAIFGYTLAICMGFGTHLYHTYSAAGGIGFYLLLAYYQVLLLSACKVVIGERPRLWQPIFAIALLVTALSYEGWLDFLVFAWLASLYAGAVLWRAGDQARLRRLTAVMIAMTACGVVYIILKVIFGYGQVAGKESDVVFNYPMMAPAIEDVISNVFTHAYLVFTNFLPPMFVSSNSLYRVGPEALVGQQLQYHLPFQYLVVMSHVFLWRYYAGAALVVFVLCTWKVIRKGLAQPSPHYLALGVFLIMAGVGGPTHDLIKFRPMNSMPVVYYHVMVGVLGISLLIAFGLMTAAARLRNRVVVVAIIAVTWSTIFYGALVRPAFLSHQAAQVGLGEGLYPNPMVVFGPMIGRPHERAPGAALYQLTKADRGTSPSPAAASVAPPAERRFGRGLPPLPTPAPGLAGWTTFKGVSVSGGPGSYAVAGNDDGGYQVVSPPIPVPKQQRVLLRVEGAIAQGSPCVGVLDREQQKWLVVGPGDQPEIVVSTGDNDQIRFVFTDCRVQPNTPSVRFTVESISYAVLQAAPVP
jgi:hypothetical protein